MGSGAGFPGVILAIGAKDRNISLKIQLIDKSPRKVNFLRELIKRNWTLGGEPSGHIICLDSTTTGDALIASLRILSSIKESNFDISPILKNFKKFPQELISLNVRSPQTIIMDETIRSEVSKVEKSLGDQGRVLLRPSGTEPLIRVMVEATSEDLARNLANELAEFIRKAA